MHVRLGIWKSVLFNIGIFLFLCILSNLSYGQKAVLSSRWFHPRDLHDSVKTIDAIKYFKPQRIDWTYTEDVKTTDVYREMGLSYSLTLNPQYPDSVGYTNLKYRIKSIDGLGYIAPWMRNWNITNPYWGCVNNPLFKDLFFRKAEKLLKLGAYGIFIDDALFNAQLKLDKPNSYGCFCEYCLEGYSKRSGAINIGRLDKLQIKNELKNNKYFIKDYEKYQEESVVIFLSQLKKKLLEQNTNIKLLTNNGNGEWNNIYKVFDRGVAELGVGNLNILYLSKAYRLADELQKTQLFTLVSNNIVLQDWLLFYNYLNGRDYVIPWDILVDTKSRKRFYMKPEYFKKTMNFLKGEIIGFNNISNSSINDNLWVKVLKLNDKNMRLIVLNAAPTKIPEKEFTRDASTLMKNLNYSKVLKTSLVIDNGKYAIYNLILR
ncbi:hypothetical protein EZ428_05370 [Pedobacter frigiditerrae]|uniref:Glycoside-hydrolase family GH114 TIM-barrel domain-containing protein n=1 Tax=Pedobacter frigiditerrae TaxID=2530452 RepID=A0A4R0N2Z0_9SPHI|nr:hypothetical protein [Pedobacter frigiditerrae]TCC94208.1 hypothetical protein EZ428_05370 [Pedobacter frigiditerrae]